MPALGQVAGLRFLPFGELITLVEQIIINYIYPYVF